MSLHHASIIAGKMSLLQLHAIGFAVACCVIGPCKRSTNSGSLPLAAWWHHYTGICHTYFIPSIDPYTSTITSLHQFSRCSSILTQSLTRSHSMLLRFSMVIVGMPEDFTLLISTYIGIPGVLHMHRMALACIPLCFLPVWVLPDVARCIKFC